MSWNLSLIDGPIPAYKFLGVDKNGSPTFGAQLPVCNLNMPAELMTPELAPYEVNPSVVKRVFSGDDPTKRTMTACLSFPDEATARKLLAEYWLDEE